MTEKHSDSISVYIIENQEMFSVFYRTVLVPEKGFNNLGISDELRRDIVDEFIPRNRLDILIYGTRELNQETIDRVTDICIRFPSLGVILLFDFYDTESIKLLQKTVRNRVSGTAVYLKGSISSTDQLYTIIKWVKDGHFIFDPALTSLILTEKHHHTFIKNLTKRELEVLSLISEGCTNSAIAARLYIDIKTVRHHINSIYSKIQDEKEWGQKHPRVNAARLYLETTGDLTSSSRDEM